MDSSVHYTSQLLARRGFRLVVIGTQVSRNAQEGQGWGIGGIEQSAVPPQCCRGHPIVYSPFWKVLCFCLPLTNRMLHDVCVLKFVNNQFEILDFIGYQSYIACHLLITIYKQMSDVLKRGGQKSKKWERTSEESRTIESQWVSEEREIEVIKNTGSCLEKRAAQKRLID
jgi:hypothetical protein